MNYFTSDLHLGHRAIAKYRPSLGSAEEQSEYWIQKIESLGKRDILFVLGDSIFDNKDYENQIHRLRNARCRIKVIMGNHDTTKLYEEITKRKDNGFPSAIEVQLPFFSYKNIWLSHCPIHPSELRNRLGNIHGHLHNAILDDERYFDVCPEKHNFKFVKYDTIKDYFNQLERNENEQN